MMRFFIVAAMLAWGLAQEPARAQDAASRDLARSIPIADIHMHATGGRGPEFYEERMNRNNVRWGGAVGGGPRDDILAIKSALGQRYIAALGQNEFFATFFARGEAGLMDPDEPRFQRLFQQAEAAFRSGAARGFGEIHINNMSRFSPAGTQRRIPLESPVVTRMFEMAGRYGGFVQIHTMAVSGEGEILSAARRHRNVKIILSHCWVAASVDQLRSLLSKAPNIFCEVSSQGTVHGIERIFSRDGVKPGWRELIEEMPTRFMLGTDACCGLDGRYDEMIAELRQNFLPAFKPQTIRRLANENARRIFGLK